MAMTIIGLAYETRLGNAKAKCVLILLADLANSDGFCVTTAASLADLTEISERQVQVILRIFHEIGLVTDLHGFQINMRMLGLDLSGVFHVAAMASGEMELLVTEEEL